ncbi:MAG TPA: hypothetical protein PKE45_14005, partial [Caldilineaceae bacterium]|nr:hypothetical protein [Caldilineaceae bacterium]
MKDEEEDEDVPIPAVSMDLSTGKPVFKPAAKPATLRDTMPSRFSPGGFTDKDIDRVLLESQDDEYKKYRQEEDEKEEKRRIREQTDEETRHDRFLGLRKLLGEHGYRRDDLADHLLKYYSMRDLLILRHHGLEWPKRGPTQSNLKEAIDRYDYEWRNARGLAGPSIKEWTQADQAALEKQEKQKRILKAQLEGYGATVGSLLGAVSGGVARQFTDDEEVIAAAAQAGATLEGALKPFAQAKGQQGSYVPHVENAPFNPYGAWRYSGPAPTVKVNPPKPGGPVAPKAPADPFAGVVQRPTDITGGGPYQAPIDPKAAIRDARLEVEQLQLLHEQLRAKASQANEVRPTVLALERKGQKPTQQQAETLAKHAELAKARDEMKARLKVAQEKLRALQPPEGARKHGKAGLDQEPKYVDELRAAGLPARLTNPNTPVIDAAIVGTPEVHSVKSIAPHEGSERAVQLADAGSPRDLAVRIAGHVNNALMDRGSAKWSLLQRRWNTSMRESHAEVYGYDLPRNPDEIRFIV